MTTEQIARVCHDVNAAYCRAIGDNSQTSWADAFEWQKTSAISCVLAHIEKGLTPEESHNAWRAEKLAAGWSYGEKKDPVRLEHPWMIPYGMLPVEQRAKDYIFGAICTALIELNLAETAEIEGRIR